MSQDLEEIKSKLKKHEDNLILNNASIEESKILIIFYFYLKFKKK